MTLNKYVEQELKKRNKGGEKRVFTTHLLTELSGTSGVALVTLQKVMHGGRLKMYETAQRVSNATGGKVTVKELCE